MVPATNQKAIYAFTWSIVSWVICPVIAAIVALVMAKDAKREIDASNGWSTGSGFVTAAKWLSWGSIVLFVAYAAFVLILIVFAATSSKP